MNQGEAALGDIGPSSGNKADASSEQALSPDAYSTNQREAAAGDIDHSIAENYA